MSSRQQRRRRKRDETRPIIGRAEFISALVVLVAAGITLGIVLLLAGDGGDAGDNGAAVQPSPVATVTSTPFEPVDADGQAFVDLGRRSVEALPAGEWPALYDAFTQEFRGRCALADFISAGEDDAANLGDSLQQIRFRYLIDVVQTADTASAVIVGALAENEYTIETSFAREDGEWKIAPAQGTAGCSAFNRLSG